MQLGKFQSLSYSSAILCHSSTVDGVYKIFLQDISDTEVDIEQNEEEEVTQASIEEDDIIDELTPMRSTKKPLQRNSSKKRQKTKEDDMLEL